MTLGNIPFLLALHKIVREGISARDVLILYAVIARPGISGVEIVASLGIENRSCIHRALLRLIEKGFMEDRRKYAQKAVPAQYHILPAGIAFWEDLKI